MEGSSHKSEIEEQGYDDCSNNRIYTNDTQDIYIYVFVKKYK